MNYGDLIHRVVWTFIQAAVGVLTSINLTGINLDAGKTAAATAAAAGIAAVLVVIKEFARSQLSTTPPAGE